MLECKRTTLADFYILKEAWTRRNLDKRFLASYTAWQTAIAQSTDKNGKPVVKKFEDLFSYEKELKALEAEETKIKVSEEDKNVFKMLTEINRKGG